MFFSSYASDEDVDKLEGRIIDGYRVTVREESIYGMATKTIVVEYAFGSYR